jgi:hypothetical protein
MTQDELFEKCWMEEKFGHSGDRKTLAYYAFIEGIQQAKNLSLSDVSISLPNGEKFKNAMDNLRNEFTKEELADLGNEC